MTPRYRQPASWTFERQNLGSVNLLEFCDYPLDLSSSSPGKDLMLATEETKPEQTPVTASELPTAERTSDWGALSSYFQGSTTGIPESSDTTVRDAMPIPPHVWVINKHTEDIIVVVSKYRLCHLSGATSDTSNISDIKFSTTV